MQCNITATGRRVRLIWGLLMLALGGGSGVLGLTSTFSFWWSISLTIGLAALGVFGIFESRKGWCAVRAMGIKTPV